LSERPPRRKIVREEWVDLGWLVVLILALLVYWIRNPSLLSDVIGLFKDALSGDRIMISEVMVNLALLFAWFSAARFFGLMVISIFESEIPLIIGNVACALISMSLGYILNSWYHAGLSRF